MQKSSYSKEDLLACAKGELFGPGNPQLPSGTLLMFDKVTCITEDGGLYGKGYAHAELIIKPNLWFFDVHFLGDPVMPGCLGLDAMWQLLGFFLGWRGGKGHGRALGMEKVSFTGQILPDTSLVTYEIHVKRVRWDRLAEANGITKADGKTVYQANNIRVGLFKQGETAI